MSGPSWIVPAAEPELTLEELCRACAVSAEWVHEHVRAGLLAPLGSDALADSRADSFAAPGVDASASAPTWRFDAALLLRVRVMHRIERDFDAVPELAALVADLQEEIRRLRLRAAGF